MAKHTGKQQRIALTSAAADVLFDSKENDETGHVPRLDITLLNQGPQGIQGVQGIPGIAGPQGATGPQGPPVSFQGAWSSATAYSTGDAVFYNGSSFISC